MKDVYNIQNYKLFHYLIFHGGYKKNTRVLLVGSLMISLFVSVPAFAQKNDEGRTGLKPINAEEEAKLSKRKIIKVRANKLALKRINKVREAKGQNKIPESSLSKKEIDIEGEIDHSLSSTTSSEAGTSELLNALLPQVDNSSLISFPNIGNQGGEGSCVAWAITYYTMSHEVCLSKGCDNKNSMSNVYSPRWTYNMINSGVDGGSYFSDAFSLMQNHGAAELFELPYSAGNYRAWDLNSEHWITALNSKMSAVSNIQSDTDAGMANVKQMLLNGHVLVLGTYINSWQYKTIQANPNGGSNSFVGQGIATHQNGTNGGHAMTIVGYDDNIWTDINGNGLAETQELGAFKIANSWGAGWRNAGYIWASYDAFRAISTVPNFAPAGRRKLTQSSSVSSITYSEYSPKLVAKVTASHLTRNQMNLQFGASTTSVLNPQKYFYPFALAYKGGAYAFNGSSTEIEGTFYFDISSLVGTSIIDQQLYYLSATDNILGNPLTIKSFEIIDPASRNIVFSASNLPLLVDGKTQQLIAGNYTIDTIAPSAPANLSAIIVSKKQGKRVTKSVSLSWSAASDNVGVVKYFIYRNNVKIAESTSLNFSDSTGSVGVSYGYSVAAVDAQNNLSAISNIVTIAK